MVRGAPPWLTIQAVTRVEIPGHDVVGIRAANPGPFTLSGTNSWIVGRAPAWLVDPGPASGSARGELAAEIDRRGGLGGIALTHDHPDHAEAVAPRCERAFRGRRLPPPAATPTFGLRRASGSARWRPCATPGHAPDHFAFVAGDLGLSGDAVLGEGSVFIAPDPGALAGYLEALARLRRRRARDPVPGPRPTGTRSRRQARRVHRPPARPRAPAAGRRCSRGALGPSELLDAAWGDVPTLLRPAAAVTLAAHLDKLADEGRLPTGCSARPRSPLREPQQDGAWPAPAPR